MSTEVRHGWLITVLATGQQYRYIPGESVIVGRTPLRPASLPDDNSKRLDIDDPQRSMSKRHLSLKVTETGVGIITDLNSTNGTYVVRDDGRLIKIPANKPLSLDQPDVKLQLGEVGVELKQFAIQEQRPVETPDLFGARPAQQQRNLNVDEIVDVREGEPTDAFSAGQVRQAVQSAQGVNFDPSAAQAQQVQQAAQAQQAQHAVNNLQAQPSQSAPAGSTGYEPGSVFDRLTRGQMSQKPAVEIDGMTSDEAKTTADQQRQYAMAQHHEFLPFLALNPYLYADLYQWLGSLGDPDIAQALSTNPGYKAFREARS